MKLCYNYAQECQIHRSIMEKSAKGHSRPSILSSVISFSAKPEIKVLGRPFLCQG